MDDQKLKTFVVKFWGSHPDLNNDDLWTVEDFDTESEAREYFRTAEQRDSTEYFELVRDCDDDGVGGVRLDIKRNDGFKAYIDDGSDNEFQMQQAMGHGVQGWNDFEGA